MSVARISPLRSTMSGARGRDRTHAPARRHCRWPAISAEHDEPADEDQEGDDEQRQRDQRGCGRASRRRPAARGFAGHRGAGATRNGEVGSAR